MQKRLTTAWYSKTLWVWCLAPLCCLFYLLSAVRRFVYRRGLKASYRSTLPVIIIGNIAVGGNGKTPLVISLSQALIKQGYTIAILSRGYGAKQTQFPYMLQNNDTAELVGDEPFLMFKRLGCEVVIDPNRARGARFIEQHCKAQVILCDDGMQHYALARDAELCVIDHRKLGNGFLLPMGPLREGKWRLSTVSAIVNNLGFTTNTPQTNTQQIGELIKLDDKHCQPFIDNQRCIQTYMQLHQYQWVNVKTAQTMSSESFSTYLKQESSENLTTLAIAGIGEPKRFFDTLHSLNIVVEQYTPFKDHHQFSSGDIPSDSIVLMTEKDAVKCTEFAHENCWYLQINASISESLLALVVKTIEGASN